MRLAHHIEWEIERGPPEQAVARTILAVDAPLNVDPVLQGTLTILHLEDAGAKCVHRELSDAPGSGFLLVQDLIDNLLDHGNGGNGNRRVSKGGAPKTPPCRRHPE